MLGVASARRIENREDLHGKGTIRHRVNVNLRLTAGRFKRVAAGSMSLHVGFQGGVQPFTEENQRDVIRILAEPADRMPPIHRKCRARGQCAWKAVRAPCARALHDGTADDDAVRVGARLAPPSHPQYRSADGPSTAREGLASRQLDALKHI